MIQIALVDDHQIVIDGISAVLQQHYNISIVATANSGNELLQKLQHTTVDILLSDVMMPEMNGQALAALVKKNYPTIKIMALSMDGSGEIVDNMINNADIDGYLLKQTGKDELIMAIEKVYHGGQYFQPVILDALDKQTHLQKQLQEVNLTLREKEIIALIEQDFGNKQIADKLFISVRTVETHRKNIFRKTNTNNVLSLIKWAYEYKVL
jgi:two-component system, NarL family, nitrate/nitrite response regulator NarL